MTKSELIRVFGKAISNNSGVKITKLVSGNNYEHMYVYKEDLVSRLYYICNSYNENLVNIENPFVKIVDVEEELDFCSQIEANPYYKETECLECNYKFIIRDKTEIQYGEYGLPFVICPNCKEKCYIENEDGIDLNEQNIKFPEHFFCYGTDKGSVGVENEEIQGWIRRALKYMKDNPKETFYQCGSGDSVVVVLNYDDEIQIIVGRNYYECYISKEEEK